MARRVQKVTVELSYSELVDVIVALRTRADFLAYRSSDHAAPYSALAKRFEDAGGDML